MCEQVISVGDFIDRYHDNWTNLERWMHIECVASIIQTEKEQEASRKKFLEEARRRPGTLEYRLDQAVLVATERWPKALGLFSNVLERGIQAYTWPQIVLPAHQKVTWWSYRSTLPEDFRKASNLLAELAVSQFNGESYPDIVWWPESIESEIISDNKLRPHWVYVPR